MAIDVESTNLYDVAHKSTWLSTGTLNSDDTGSLRLRTLPVPTG